MVCITRHSCVQKLSLAGCTGISSVVAVIPWWRLLCLLAVLATATAPCAAQRSRSPDEIRLHEIQLIGTHNSYHLAPHAPVGGLISTVSASLLESIEYSHMPLPEQLEQLQVRQLELDVYADPEGGLFATPIGRSVVVAAGQDPGPDPNADGTLSQPGFKVLHAPGFDFLTTVTTLRQAFLQIRTWSTSRPDHLPVMILLELKESAPGPTGVQVVRYSPELLQQLNALICEIFPPDARFTPQDLCAAEDLCVRDAVLRRGWPQLRNVRGRVFFCLDNEGVWTERYLDACATPKQAVLFVSVAPEHPQAAWMKRNDPQLQFAEIQSLVERHFLIRTRADADTIQSRRNDGSRREQAMASGAQYISTDFPQPQPRFSEYSVRWPDGQPARYSPRFTAPPAPDVRWEVRGD
jgi:hypothetical protein